MTFEQDLSNREWKPLTRAELQLKTAKQPYNSLKFGVGQPVRSVVIFETPEPLAETDDDEHEDEL